MTNEDRDDIRPEVVEALMDMRLDLDVSAMARVETFTPAVTQAELAAAQRGIEQVYLDRFESGDSDRQLEVWEILTTTRFGASDLSWLQIWSALTDVQRDRLVELYDVLPEQLVTIVDDYRNGEPGL
jgi:hypothetical protein